MYENKKQKVNSLKGKKGFSKNYWNEADLSRLFELHTSMQKYKSDRPKGLKYIHVAHSLVGQ